MVGMVQELSAENLQETLLVQLAALLATRLGQEIDEADFDKKFLELGFDSLAMSQLAGRLRQQFDVRVPVRQLFDKLATPRLLANHLALDRRVATIVSTQPAVDVEDGAPATLRHPGLPHRGLTAEGLEPEGACIQFSPTDAQPDLREVLGRLQRLEQLLERLVERDSPRTLAADRLEEHDFSPPGFGVDTVRELTHAEREIWVGAKIGANLCYNECRAFLFRGALRVDHLTRSLEELVARHEALRHTFGEAGDVCHLQPSGEISLEVTDLRALPDDVQKHRFFGLMTCQVEQPFELLQGPLFRASLARLGDEENALILCAHYLVADGSSWEILIRELAELYSAKLEGRATSLPAAESFGDYVLLEARYRRSRQASTDEAFWLGHLDGQAEDLNLPTDRPRPPRRTFSSARLDQQLSEQLVGQLKDAATELFCTPQTFLFAAFRLLLFRLTGQRDIVCGVPTSGQVASGMDGLVGHCVHVLPLRLVIDQEADFAEHVKRVQATMLDGLEHQRASFSDVLPKLNRPRDPKRPALMQAAFGMGRSQKRPRFAGLDTALRVVPRVAEMFELYVYVTADQRGLEVSWSYNTDLFNAETIQHWQQDYVDVVEEMSRRP